MLQKYKNLSLYIPNWKIGVEKIENSFDFFPKLLTNVSDYGIIYNRISIALLKIIAIVKTQQKHSPGSCKDQNFLGW